jgi:hypothetical protein
VVFLIAANAIPNQSDYATRGCPPRTTVALTQRSPARDKSIECVYYATWRLHNDDRGAEPDRSHD